MRHVQYVREPETVIKELHDSYETGVTNNKKERPEKGIYGRIKLRYGGL